MSLAPDEDFLRFAADEADAMADELREQAQQMRARSEARCAGVEREIAERWAEGWELFDCLVYATQQSGALLIDRWNEADDEYGPVRQALSLVHAAAALILQEIRVVLRSGLWGASGARWRALHELGVTATLLVTGGPKTAQRYVDHAFVVQTRRLTSFHATHGFGPVGREELDERARHAATLIDRHEHPQAGCRFTDAYGWAADLMPPAKRGDRLQRPNMERLERLADVSHLRRHMAFAHGLVHADSAGVVAAVVMEDGFLLGPSAQFADVGARAAIVSMRQVFAATHGGFEPELNEAGRTLVLLAAAFMTLSERALAAFPRAALSD